MISVVIPFLNAEATLGYTLRAVLRQQDPGMPWEVVLADNGSRDGSRRVVEEMLAELSPAVEVRVVGVERRGACAARNGGVRAARGELLVFTDADCLPEPHWLRRLAARREPGVAAIGGPVLAWPGSNAAEVFLDRCQVLNQERAFAGDAFGVPFFVTANVAYEREWFDRVGGFNEELVVAGEDADLAWRVQDAGGRLVYEPCAPVLHRHRASVLGLYRQHWQYGYGWMDLLLRHQGRFAGRECGSAATPEVLYEHLVRGWYSSLPWSERWQHLLHLVAKAGHAAGAQARRGEG